jgi:outer membrane murein-binding lipoprotein Lpp
VPRSSALPLTAVLLTGLLLTGCADSALTDRVAEIEASQERLRTSLTEMGAPDPDVLAARDAAAAEVAVMSTTVTTLQTTLDALLLDLGASALEADGRLTTTELEADELRARVTELTTAINVLTSELASVEAQLDAHRDDAFGHS